jgi:hypothetical protein
MQQDLQRRTINAIAGEFMGADKKRGRVYTWLPLHLSDARGQSSPRTFLTAWREAARWHEAKPPGSSRLAVDHLGLHEGVRKASQGRLAELQEDYWWIPEALAPLGGEQVPMDRSRLRTLWQQARTTRTIRDRSGASALPPIRLDAAVVTREDPEDALLADLVAIAVVEERPNYKINVPDIFRLEARIKRKGGVPAPKRGDRG